MHYLVQLISLFFLGIIFNLTLSAQELEYCGTETTEADMAWLKSFKQNPPTNFKMSEELIYLPIQFHIVGDDLGNGYYKQASVLQMMCDLNADLEATDHVFRFYIYENEFQYHNASFIYNHPNTNGQTASFFNQNNNDEAVNIYLVADPIGACGYYSTSANMVCVAKSCAGPEATTFIHELGHFFSLPHTFVGWEYYDDDPPVGLWENVDRTGPNKNCHNTADLFCDTGPDYLDFRWGCPWDSLTDAYDVPFNVDGSFYMSYSLNSCRSRFSEEQKEAMEANLLFQRSYLLDHQQDLNFEPISETTVHYPAGGSIPAGDVLFQWATVEGVTAYQFRVSGFTSGFELDTLLTTNEIVLSDLPAGELHVWGVKPYNDGNYCVPAVSGNFVPSANAQFSLNDLNVVQPSCHAASDGSITIEVGGGDGNYEFLWEDGTVGATIENIEEGTYDVDVTDGSGNTETIKIKVGEPDAVTGTVSQGLNGQLSLDIDGGFGPYSVEWPNGDTSLTTVGLEAGEQNLLLLDPYGCEVDLTFTVLNIVTETTNISCADEIDGQFEIISVVGGTAPYTYYFEETLMDDLIIDSLATGQYEIEVLDNLGNSARFDFEITTPEAVEMEVTGDDFFMVASGSGGTPPYQIEWNIDGQFYEGDSLELSEIPVGVYSVTLIDDLGCTNVKDFTVLFSGIENLNDVDGYLLNVFPNPVVGGYFILGMNFVRSEMGSLQIFDEMGKEIYSSQKKILPNQDSWKIDTQNWNTGIYFLQLKTESGQWVQKIIID